MKHLDSLTIEELDYIKEKYDLKENPIPRDYSNATGNYVYYLYKDETLLYIGKTSNIRNRIASHLSITDLNKYEWKREINKVYVEEYKNLKETSLKEGYLINKLNPPNNVIIPKEKEDIKPIKEYWYEIKDKSVHLEDVLYTIEYGLKKAFKGQTLDLKELVRKSLYSVETSNRTIAGWFTDPRYADSLQSLMKKYKAEYYTKKGRGGGTFAKLPKGIHF